MFNLSRLTDNFLPFYNTLIIEYLYKYLVYN